MVAFKSGMNVGGQLDLDALVTGFDAVGGAVVQGDPVGENIMRIQALDQKPGLINGGKAGFPPLFRQLLFQARPIWGRTD